MTSTFTPDDRDFMRQALSDIRDDVREARRDIRELREGRIGDLERLRDVETGVKEVQRQIVSLRSIPKRTIKRLLAGVGSGVTVVWILAQLIQKLHLHWFGL